MGSHPLRTLPAKGGGRRLPGSSLRAYFFVQSGHGSQPQPVHAWRNTGEMILTDSSRGPSAAVLEARLPQVPEVVDDEAP